MATTLRPSTSLNSHPKPPSRVQYQSDPKIGTKQAYSLAHTARCKLSFAAKDPEKRLRFLLGHAFMLDQALYRVAQVDFDDDDEVEKPKPRQNRKTTVATAEVAEDEDEGISGATGGQSGSLAKGTVDFNDADANAARGRARETDEFDPERTPSPSEFDNYDDSDSDDEGAGGGLTRFESAAAQPPRMVPDQGDDVEDDEPVSPPALPADLDVGAVIAGPENEEMGELYEKVRGCPCHGMKEKTDKGTKFWEIGAGDGAEKSSKRLAIMQVEA